MLSGRILTSDRDAGLSESETVSAFADLIDQQAAQQGHVQLPVQFKPWLLSSSTFKAWIKEITQRLVPGSAFRQAPNLS